MQPIEEGFTGCIHLARILQRLRRDAHDHGQHVLYAMIELGNQNALLLLGLRQAGHVAERQDGALDLAAAGPVGQRAHDVMRRAVAPVDSPLQWLARAEYLLDVLRKRGIVEIVGDIGQRPATVAGNEIEDAGHGWREAAKDQLAVEKDGGDLRAFIQVLEVGIGAIEFVDLDGQLVIDGLQLLVDRLQLLLRRFQLLVGRLQLLVDRGHLLVTGFELFDRGLVLLRHRLQPLARLAQLALEMLEVAVAPLALALLGRTLLRRGRGQLAEHDEIEHLVVIHAQRLDRDPDKLGLVVASQLDVVAHRGALRFDRLVQGGTQRQAQALARHRHQRAAWPPGWRLQILSGAGGIIDDVALAANHDVGRRVTLTHARLDRLLQRAARWHLALGRAAAASNTMPAKQRGQPWHGRAVLPALEDAVLLVDRGEQIAVLRDVLGRAEEQEAMRLERIVEDRDDVPLQLAVEIDEKIAAGDQVHARKRRIAHHAMRREHAQVADRLLDDVAGAFGGEEALQPLLGNALQQGIGIAARASHRQRRLVDIGGEELDFHARAALLGLLAQHNRERIDLFAGGAARHPYADGVRGTFAFEQARHHHLLQRLERLGVAEKISDADQQVAKQRVDLAGILT